jgi:hypothetical protein
MSPDRYRAGHGKRHRRHSVSLRNPASWNRYAYVLGDPINYNDRRGRDPEKGDDDDDDDGGRVGGDDDDDDDDTAEATSDMASTTAELGPQAEEAVQGLGLGCNKFFSGITIPTSDTPGVQGSTPVNLLTAMEFNATNVNYVNSFDNEGSLTLSQIGYTQPNGQPYNPNETVAQYYGSQSSAVAESAGGAAILLGTAFYGASPQFQNIVLVHELLHISYGNSPTATDVGIATQVLGVTLPSDLTGAALTNAASLAITSFLQSDCGTNP